jgi:hypothetical protein
MSILAWAFILLVAVPAVGLILAELVVWREPTPEQLATREELRAETLRYALQQRERGRVSSDYTREGVEPWWGGEAS